MTRDDLTLLDLKNIAAAVSNAEVKGVNAAAQLLVLHNKLSSIIEAEENGSRNGAKPDQSSSHQPAAADDQQHAGDGPVPAPNP